MESPPYVIRAFEPEDLPQLSDVLSQPRVIWGTLQMPHTSVGVRRARLEGKPMLHLVVVQDGRVVGSGGLETFDRRRAHVGSIGMSIHDAWAGKGLGSALFGALVEQADRWLNLKRLELTVWSDNARAIGLYEKHGFEREGFLRAYAWRDGAYADALAMARLRI